MYLLHVAPSAPVRLVGGSTCAAGKLEVQFDGVWGEVCYSNWNQSEAEVVCRQLGHAAVVDTWSVPIGDSRIWLSGVQCSGSEDALSRCQHNGWGTVEIYSGKQAVWVQCQQSGSCSSSGESERML